MKARESGVLGESSSVPERVLRVFERCPVSKVRRLVVAVVVVPMKGPLARRLRADEGLRHKVGYRARPLAFFAVVEGDD